MRVHVLFVTAAALAALAAPAVAFDDSAPEDLPLWERDAIERDGGDTLDTDRPDAFDDGYHERHHGSRHADSWDREDDWDHDEGEIDGDHSDATRPQP